jgi:hypothetical protein
MSLRSRTLRASLLRLSRRAMRLTTRRSHSEAATITSARARFSELIWRRACPPRLPREKASALHLHESHVLLRPDVRVSVQMHLAASRVPHAAAVVLSRSTRQRRPDIVFATGPSGRLRWTRSLSELLPHRLRTIPALLESPSQAASLARQLIARVLTSWPARALVRPDVAQRAGLAAREAALPFPALRPTRARSGPTESRPERRHLLRRESSFRPRLIRYRLADQGMRESQLVSLRSPAFLSVARLHPRETATAGPAPSNLLMWREVAPVTLHYANSRAMTPPATHIEHTTAVPAAPTVARPPQPTAHSARAVAAPVLDRVATDRLADEVIRRIERRVRIERERRGI